MTHRAALVLRAAMRTEVGCRGGANEDTAHLGRRVFAVADGMGGHAHGEVASAAAGVALAELDRTVPAGLAVADAGAALAGAVAGIAARLAELAAADPELAGMGSTLTALLWTGSGFAGAHIGDSRGYLLRDGVLHQLTRDHTLVQALVDDGRITAEAAAGHPRRSVLMRALQAGGPADPEPDLFDCPARPGDRYLLCSDGLTDYVPIESVAEALRAAAGPRAAADRLVDLSAAAGGQDNTTCLVIDVVPRGGLRRLLG
jgi:serine/threonine protein phosphatase PrpC